MGQKYKISVVLSTYNGEIYIQEQLESIENQTRKADEVLIFDDCSTDNTVNVVKQFIKNNKLDNWFVSVNGKNKGWKRNFMEGFHEATGDIIFCADQDDIWMDNKLELMENTMLSHEEINVLACNLIPKFEDPKARLGEIYIKSYGKNILERVSVDTHALLVIRPGCTMCFRKSFLTKIDNIWFPEMAHDAALWSAGLVTNSSYILNIPLIQFRRHGNNNSPISKKNKESRIIHLKHQIDKYNVLLTNADGLNIDIEKCLFLNQKCHFFKDRISAVESGNIIYLIKLLKYYKHYYSYKEWLADCISSFK